MFVILLVTSFVITNAQEKGDRYVIKSGHIEYQLTGNIKGTKTIWWDDYGNKSREEINTVSEIKIFGMTSKEETHTISITIGNLYWTANMKDKTGTKGKSELYDESKEIAENMTEAEAKQLEKDLMDNLNGEKLGNEQFMGRTCEVYSIMGVKSWIYKAVPLKTEGKVLGVESNEVATTFEENVSVPESKFKPIAGIEYQEINVEF